MPQDNGRDSVQFQDVSLASCGPRDGEEPVSPSPQDATRWDGSEGANRLGPRGVAASPRIVRLQGGGLRFLDAHEISQLDFTVVTRPAQNDQNNRTQHWRLTNVGAGSDLLRRSSSP